MPKQKLIASASPRLTAILSAASCSLLLISGCGSASLPLSTDYSKVAGIWQLNSSSAMAARLPVLGGYLNVNGSSVTGDFGPLVPAGGSALSLCVPVTADIPVTGSISPSRQLTLTSAGFAGGTITISGTLASDNHSLANASYSVANGSCAFAAAAPAIMAADAEPVGTYTGTFTADDNTTSTVTASIETGTYNTNGNYRVKGVLNMVGPDDCIPNPGSESDTFIIKGTSFTAKTLDLSLDATDSQDGTSILINTINFTAGPCTGATAGPITLTQTSTTPQS